MTDPAPDRDAGEVARAEWTIRVAEGAEPAGDLLGALANLLIAMEDLKPNESPDVTRCQL